MIDSYLAEVQVYIHVHAVIDMRATISKQFNHGIHDAIDNYVITSGFALRIVMYGSCQCLKGSYFAQL